MSNNNYQHWHKVVADDNVVWLAFDRKDSEVNTINVSVLTELDKILDEIGTKNHTGLVIHSAKKTGFIAGADVSQFTKIQDVNEAVSLVQQGQKVFQKIDDLSFPTVAMISGFCLGGGLELALACDYRVAEDKSSTRLGLPEVKLGIHPGWGGTVRLPNLIGVTTAMDLILSGRTIAAKQAQRLNLVEAAVPLRQLKRAVKYYINTKPKKQSGSKWQSILSLPPFNSLLAGYLRKQLTKKISPEHYPAPFAVVENWLRYGTKSEQSYINEASSLGQLFLGDTAKNLLRVFELQEELKKIAKPSDFEVNRVHVVGAGTMGGDIAIWCAFKGLQVTLQDKNTDCIASTMARAYQLFKKKLKKPHLIQAALDRLMPDVNGSGLESADVIIEAVFEDLTVKQEIFKSIEKNAKPDAILATNTSSIPLDDINTVMTNPNRLVGLHFFNPVALMPLIEVIVGSKTDESIQKFACAFARTVDRLPLPVKSSPGFLVNRILLPYMLEAVALVEEGTPEAAVDKAAKDFGMPMGPVELADKVGLDVCLHVAKNLNQHFKFSIPKRLEDMVEKGWLGCKTKQGFYHYNGTKIVKPDLPKDLNVSPHIIERLIGCMEKEAKACMQEGIVTTSERLDAGMIFGAGFAPFRGGLMNYIQSTEEIK